LNAIVIKLLDDSLKLNDLESGYFLTNRMLTNHYTNCIID